MGEFCTRCTDVCVSLQTVPLAESEVPLENVNLNGMMTTGTVVVAEPDAGLVPIMVKGNVVPWKVKLLLHMGILGAAAAARRLSSALARGITMKNGTPFT